MDGKSDKTGLGRRGFLGVLAGVSAATTAAGSGAAVAQESAEEAAKARYQESPHVLKYYEVNRY